MTAVSPAVILATFALVVGFPLLVDLTAAIRNMVRRRR